MIRILMLCGALALSGLPAAAQTGPGRAIEGVIQNQFDAFQADDFDRAFTFASPMIKGMFGTPERFGAMVRNGYPMVWRPAEVDYLDLREEGGRLQQRVMITDGSGAVHLLDYEMIQTETGWQINGVRFVRPPRIGA